MLSYESVIEELQSCSMIWRENKNLAIGVVQPWILPLWTQIGKVFTNIILLYESYFTPCLLTPHYRVVQNPDHI